MTAARKHVGPWTVDDLLAMPEDENRYELVEGTLLMVPPPSPQHQDLSFQLHTLLKAAARRADAPVRIWEAVGVQTDHDQLLVPDIVVAEGLHVDSRPVLASNDVLLVVEIVSPGSRARDRTEKPYLYAEAGIPYFWRVETQDYRGRSHELPVVITHELVNLAEYGVKQTVGAGETFRVAEPFPVEFDPADLD